MNYLRIFHFKSNLDEGTYFTDGKIYLAHEHEDTGLLTPEIRNFFEQHADSVSSSKRIQNIRFKGPLTLFIDYFDNLFESYDTFRNKTKKIAEKFEYHLTNARRKDFILILFDMETTAGKALVILTMEARNGLQLNNDNFNVITDLLPESTAKLKKAAIIFENETMTFKENREAARGEEELPVRHGIVIDSQMVENNITLSFTNFLDSQTVADRPAVVGRILLDVFPKQLHPYYREGVKKETITNELKIMFSAKKNSNFKNVTEHLIEKCLSIEKLREDNLDSESLANKIFRAARRKNSSINMKFEAEVVRIPKKVLKDKRGGKNINLLISESSIRDGYVDFNDEAPDEYVIKIKKAAVEIEQK